MDVLRTALVRHPGNEIQSGLLGQAPAHVRKLALRDLALDSIRQGICVFDGQHRLVLFNRRYAELYRLDPAQLRVGMVLKEVVDLRYAAGTGPGMTPNQYAAWRERIGVADKVTDTEVVLRDGRVLAIHHAPTADGGWVSTHECITARRQAEAQIRHMAHHDALTALPNRSLFGDRLASTLARLRGQNLEDHRPAPQNGSWMIGVLFLDLDDFKQVNDTLGHAAGDELLQVVSRRIGRCIGQEDLLARLGGDEFAILLEGLTKTDDAALVAERIIAAVSKPIDLSGMEARVGTSIGIAIASGWDQDAGPALLLRQADKALYRAKDDGRNRFRFFNPRLNEPQHTQGIEHR